MNYIFNKKCDEKDDKPIGKWIEKMQNRAKLERKTSK